MCEIEELVEATNLHNESMTTINDERLQAACLTASGIVDGYLMLKYQLPLNLSDKPALAGTLRVHAGAIARQRLGGVTDEVQANAKTAYDWLERFSKADVLEEDSTPPNGGSGTPSTPTAPDPIEKAISFEVGRRYWTPEQIAGLD
jgi:phage gp36-like protein